MKTIKYYTITFILIFVFTGCVETFRTKEIASYIACYLNPTKMRLKFEKTDINIIHLYLNYDISNNFVHCFSKDNEYDKFLSLATKHNDLTYDGSITYFSDDKIPLIFGINTGLNYNPKYINITSDQDFDEEHKAGSSLNDLILLYFYDLYSWIKSGYSYENDAEFKKILLSEATTEDMMLMFTTYYAFTDRDCYSGIDYPNNRDHCSGCAIQLHFNTTPTLSKEHTITVTMESDDGRIFSESTDIVFE